jgi:processive 1,2-diacylglycerol beta-glucosyltransferase
MRRVLILHALLGTGHQSAARALGAAFTQLPGVEAIVEDSLDFVNPALSSLWKGAYKGLSERAADLYARLYRSSDTPDAGQAALSNLHGAEIGRVFFRKLERYVAETRPDAVIAVMSVPLALMSQLKVQGALGCPLYAVITDYVAHSTWLYPDVARYFVPSDFTAQLLAWQGLAPEQIQVTGIPVGAAIAAPKDQAEVRARRGLPADRPLLTVFGGGVDPAAIHFIVSQLLAAGRPLTLAVCAGRNEALLEALADLEGNDTVGMVKYGPIDFVDDMVVASDLVISKPGGLITSEVLARGRPMVAIAPLPGQEEPNADFLAATGAGVALRVPELAPAVALHLLSEPELLAHMAAGAARVGRPRAAGVIAEQIMHDLASA